MEWIQAGFYFLSPWYLQLYEHVCICESVGIQGIKNEFVYQAREEILCSLPATDKITISIPIAKYSWCIQNKDTMAFLGFFFPWRLIGLFPFRRTQLCYIFSFFFFFNAHFSWPWVSTFSYIEIMSFWWKSYSVFFYKIKKTKQIEC